MVALLRLGTDPVGLAEQILVWIVITAPLWGGLLVGLWLWGQVSEANETWTELEAELTIEERRRGLR